MLSKVARDILPVNKSRNRLELVRVTAKVVRCLGNPFVIHKAMMPGRSTGHIAQFYVSVSLGWNADMNTAITVLRLTSR